MVALAASAVALIWATVDTRRGGNQRAAALRQSSPLLLQRPSRRRRPRQLCFAAAQQPVVVAAADDDAATETQRRNATRASGLSYFLGCAAAGAISTATSHSLFFPLDVLKTKMQSDAALAGLSASRAFRRVLQKDGPRHLLSGFSANAMGYFSQGAIKFGLYETGKATLSDLLENHPWFRDKHLDASEARWRVPIWIVSSACAEVVACIALCPMESTKIRLVTDRHYASNAFLAARRLVREEGVRALYRGASPILIRQVPYTVAKLAGYEALSTLVGGGLLAGVLAGAFAAAVSQPGDVILSKLCGGSAVARLETCFISVSAVVESLSVGQLFVGLTPRATMCAAICAGQFFFYEALKPTKQVHAATEDAVLDLCRSDQDRLAHLFDDDDDHGHVRRASSLS